MASIKTNSSDTKETIATLSDITNKGLALPTSAEQFVNNRHIGKIEELYSYNGNAEVLYTVKYDDKYYTGQFSERIDNNDYIIGKRFKSALTDAEFITKFLETSRGTHFLTRQFLLQGYQPFDETKLYNPASPILAAAEPGLWGLLNHPVRHIDTSNVIDGVIDGVGLGTVRDTISDVASTITGNSYERAVTPPRSSVASEASSGLSVNTATSLLGAGSKVNQVLAPLARDSAKGLLRGGTATEAYTSPRYSRITSTEASGTIVSRLANKAVSYIASKTAVGSLVNPVQPWDAKFRADEKTYDFLLTSKDLFYPDENESLTSGITNITDGVIGAVGFSKAVRFNSTSIPQRFHAAFNEYSTMFKGSVFRHSIDSFIDYLSTKYNSLLAYNKLELVQDGSLKYDQDTNILKGLNININPIGLLNTTNDTPQTRYAYTDLINRGVGNDGEISDILYEYKAYVDSNSNISDQTHITRISGNDETSIQQKTFVKTVGIEESNDIDLLKKNKEFYSQGTDVKKYQTTSSVDDNNKSIKTLYDKTLNNPDFIFNNRSSIGTTFSDIDKLVYGDKLSTFEKISDSINNKGGNDSVYEIDLSSKLYPDQFRGDDIGFSYLAKKTKDNNIKYTSLSENSKFPTINLTNSDRALNGSYKPNYVNTLDPLKDDEFDENYLDKNNYYGPDLVKFYFYDIVNRYYIPFTAIINTLTETNNADWQRVDYIGRADRLFHYGGFNRTLNLNFKIYIGSLKELLPTWKRLNYLASLIRPANYTDTVKGGAIVPPMVQLTLGDIYKNHFIIINSVNISIPNDASWELVPESKQEDWEYGINQALKAKKGTYYAQFPREAEVALQINILEKDRPMVGHAIWGDAPFKFGTTNETLYHEEVYNTVGLNKYRTGIFSGETVYEEKGNASLKETYTLTGYYENQEYFEPYDNRDFSNKLITHVNSKKLTKVDKEYKGELYKQYFNPQYGNLESTEAYEQTSKGYATLDSNGDIIETEGIIFDRDEDFLANRSQFVDTVPMERVN